MEAALIQTFANRKTATIGSVCGLALWAVLAPWGCLKSPKAAFRVLRRLKIPNFNAFFRPCLFLCSHTIVSFLCWLFVWGQ